MSPGCDHCYAEALDKRYFPLRLGASEAFPEVVAAHWGPGTPRRTFADRHWNEVYNWDQKAEREGRKALVFCASMADVMDDDAPEGQRERLWDVINNTPHLIWQLLTKRPHRFVRYLPEKFTFKNVWLGFTAENQEFYNVRWPIVRDYCEQHPGFVTFCSYEPALGPVLPSNLEDDEIDWWPDWFIFGGESGLNHRPCDVRWLEALRDECQERDIALFVKQMSARTPTEGKALIPPELRIQQFPS